MNIRSVDKTWMSELLLGLVSFYFYWTPHMWFENRIKEKQFKKNDHDVQFNIQRQPNKKID